LPDTIIKKSGNVFVFATESAPGLAISGITGGYILKLIVALGSVLVIFFLLALLTKKFHRFGQSQNRDLTVLSTMSLGTRERLMVVKVGEAQLLLGVTPGRIDNLFVLDTPLKDTVAADNNTERAPDTSTSSDSDDSSTADFRDKLNQFIGKGRPSV
jgi:flagellar protein FliO/FliZ